MASLTDPQHIQTTLSYQKAMFAITNFDLDGAELLLRELSWERVNTGFEQQEWLKACIKTWKRVVLNM